MNESKKIKFVIDSDLRLIPFIGAAVNGICSLLLASEMECYQMELCVVEAVTNSIKHAYGLRKGNDVEIEVFVYPEKFVFKVWDEGVRLEQSLFEQKKNMKFKFDADKDAEIPERGRGLAIINEIMDEVTYETLEGKNIITMMKWINTEKEHDDK